MYTNTYVCMCLCLYLLCLYWCLWHDVQCFLSMHGTCICTICIRHVQIFMVYCWELAFYREIKQERMKKKKKNHHNKLCDRQIFLEHTHTKTLAHTFRFPFLSMHIYIFRCLHICNPPILCVHTQYTHV